MRTSAIMDFTMPPKKGGRPQKDAGEQGTAQVRIYTDLAEKIYDLADLLDRTAASICDPILRAEVEEQWEEHRAAIEKMRALRKQQEEIREKTAAKKQR